MLSPSWLWDGYIFHVLVIKNQCLEFHMAYLGIIYHIPRHSYVFLAYDNLVFLSQEDYISYF